MSTVPALGELKTLMAPAAQGQPQTVPVFAPDGTLGDIPQSNLVAAVKAGAKPGITMRAPDGSLGVVPADRYQDAYKAGAKIVPLNQQETDHPDFWQHAMEIGKQVAARYQPSLQLMGGATGLKNITEGAPAAPAQAAPKSAPVYRDATLDQTNIPEYAGEAPAPASREAVRDFWKQRGGGMVDQPIDRQAMQGGPQIGQKQAILRQAEALRQPTQDVVNSAIPATNKAANMQAQAQVDFYLKRGDVASAEKALDTAAAKVDPKYAPPETRPLKDQLKDELIRLNDGKPLGRLPTKVIIGNDTWEMRYGEFYKNGKHLEKTEDIVDATDALGSVDPESHRTTIEGEIVQPKLKAAPPAPVARPAQWPPDAPTDRGSTNDIREQLPANVAKRRADLLDDQAFQQEMKWDEEHQGLKVESDARKEFIARNSTGMTKGKLIQQARIAKPGAGPADEGQAFSDLTDILQKSLEAARKAKGAR
jgi:hypothetical protein